MATYSKEPQGKEQTKEEVESIKKLKWKQEFSQMSDFVSLLISSKKIWVHIGWT